MSAQRTTTIHASVAEAREYLASFIAPATPTTVEVTVVRPGGFSGAPVRIRRVEATGSNEA